MEKKKNIRHSRKVRNLIILLAFTAMILSISTYAWFIGMRTVNVSSFDVSIASTDSLLLSLDGKKWDTTVSISSETFDDVNTVYSGHTNWWAGKGLSPVSSIGEIDEGVSRLKMYEKSSITTTPGGYRIMSSRVDNTKETELDGYVAFDLFIRNYSGAQYLSNLNVRDEEAIYLLPDSEVKVADSGGVADTGIENSVRVAFSQIGRVKGTLADSNNQNDINTITGIQCKTNDDVTGICSRISQIWEPNDTSHVKNAISWYNKSCKTRINPDLTLESSYTTPCKTIADGTAYPTYAIRGPISSENRVDVYDGSAYNSYTNSNTYLYDFPYFTDTMKNLTGVERPQFMTLAPNSITKVRIYIYLEGQDVDNYDFAAIGKKISVNFGFTKERFNEGDINYDGPAIRPEITLNGEETMLVGLGSEYTEPGATAVDTIDGDITDKLIITGNVNTSEAGTYTITYRVTNSNELISTKTRTVTVE